MEQQISQRAMEERALMQKDPKLLSILLDKERTIESKLRTTLSVINTAAAVAALGIVMIKLFGEQKEAFYLGTFLLLCSLAMTLYAISRFMHYNKESKMIKKYRADLVELIE